MRRTSFRCSRAVVSLPSPSSFWLPRLPIPAPPTDPWSSFRLQWWWSQQLAATRCSSSSPRAHPCQPHHSHSFSFLSAASVGQKSLHRWGKGRTTGRGPVTRTPCGWQPSRGPYQRLRRDSTSESLDTFYSRACDARCSFSSHPVHDRHSPRTGSKAPTKSDGLPMTKQEKGRQTTTDRPHLTHPVFHGDRQTFKQVSPSLLLMASTLSSYFLSHSITFWDGGKERGSTECRGRVLSSRFLPFPPTGIPSSTNACIVGSPSPPYSLDV